MTVSAEILRKAAAVLRERAKAATPGPWRDSSTEDGVRFGALVSDRPHPDRANPEKGGWAYDEGYGGCLVGESHMSWDRAYLATVDPTFGVAVADWLDNEALEFEIWGPDDRNPVHAVAVARAVLGEAS